MRQATGQPAQPLRPLQSALFTPPALVCLLCHLTEEAVMQSCVILQPLLSHLSRDIECGGTHDGVTGGAAGARRPQAHARGKEGGSGGGRG